MQLLCPLESGGISIPDRPLYILNKSIGNRGIVELRNKREYRGVLVGYDPHMNLWIPSIVQSRDPAVMDFLIRTRHCFHFLCAIMMMLVVIFGSSHEMKS